MDNILGQVFGCKFPVGKETLPFEPSSNSTDSSVKSHETWKLFKYVDDFISHKLEAVCAKESSQSSKNAEKRGKVGNQNVCFDKTTILAGTSILSDDCLTVCSQTSFSTIFCNCAVYRGKWQYEVHLCSSGIMQLGWANLCYSSFSHETGVGDTKDSYAFDGNRICKWNVLSYKYGERWMRGDVIGFCIDLDEGSMEFFMNGKSMGVAFNKIHTGPNMAYFPAVTLSLHESISANFGSKPFKYPVPGYEPLQKSPVKELSQATCLLEWIGKLLAIFDSTIPSKASTGPVSSNTFLLAVGQMLMSRLLPLMVNPYVMESKIITFLQGYCDDEPDGQRSVGEVRPSARVSSQKHAAIANKRKRLMTFLDLLLAASEEQELTEIVESLIITFSDNFKTNMMDLEFQSQHATLQLLNSLLKHKQFRRYNLQNTLFENLRLFWFFNLKFRDTYLDSIVSTPWWETGKGKGNHFPESQKRSYMESVSKIRNSASLLERRQVEFLVTLLDPSDGSDTEPSTRSIFLRKFRSVLQGVNNFEVLQDTLHPFGWQFLQCSLSAFKTLWEKEVGSSPVVIPISTFLDGSVKYFNIDRVGGILSHIQSTSNQEDLLASEEQSSHVAVQPGTASDKLSVHSNGVVHESQSSLLELLDGVIWFYEIVAHKQLYEIKSAVAVFKKYVESYEEIQNGISAYNLSPKTQCDNTLRDLLSSSDVLFHQLKRYSSEMAWIRATILSSQRQDNLLWLLRIVTSVIQNASSNTRATFRYVPEFYLCSMIDMLSVVTTVMPPLAPVKNSAENDGLLCSIVQFVCEHINDNRIRAPKASDKLMKGLTNIICEPRLLNCAHIIPNESRNNLIRFLLLPYEDRAWASSNWILMRIWQGSPQAFAFRKSKLPFCDNKLVPNFDHSNVSFYSEIEPCPSPVLQAQLGNVLMNDSEAATSFVNSLLNQLNWSFSEFIGMLQELQNVSSRTQRIIVETRQLKICSTCFDISLSLLRVLEMIANIALPIFTDSSKPSSDLLLFRLCQLLSQILIRVSSESGCFQHIINSEIPNMGNVSYFPIVTAVCGILTALLCDDLKWFLEGNLSVVPKVTRQLLSEPNFQMKSIRFLLGDSASYFSFKDYKDDISADETAQVRTVVDMLEHYGKCLSDSKAAEPETDSQDVCTICYSFPNAATFEPCKHQSCE